MSVNVLLPQTFQCATISLSKKEKKERKKKKEEIYRQLPLVH